MLLACYRVCHAKSSDRPTVCLSVTPSATFGHSIFARDNIYAIARICDRNSVWTSGRLSVTRVDCTKTVEARIMKLESLSDLW